MSRQTKKRKLTWGERRRKVDGKEKQGEGEKVKEREGKGKRKGKGAEGEEIKENENSMGEEAGGSGRKGLEVW